MASRAGVYATLEFKDSGMRLLMVVGKGKHQKDWGDEQAADLPFKYNKYNQTSCPSSYCYTIHKG